LGRVSGRKFVAILAIDAGTTGVTALVVSAQGEIVARGYTEFEQHFPAPGWVEHDPQQIWDATLHSCKQALDASPLTPIAIGITNQRETAVVWDRKTLESPTRAIVWQDRRTADLTDQLQQLNPGDWIRYRTGLKLDPYFTSSKFLWWKKNLPAVWAGVESGRYALGTVDSYLAARISGGALHITDATNASRTQLMNLETASWDPELLAAFGIPLAALPEIVSNWGNYGNSNPEHFVGITLPITGMAGDQQAALFGQCGYEVGDSKATYGTGAFILTNTGNQITHSEHGLLATMAYQDPSGKNVYAIEGSVFVAGAAVQWLRDSLKIIEKSSEVEALASEAGSSGGAVFVQALTGLGAPFWDPEARGSILGITRGTTDSNLAFATLEAIAFSVQAVLAAMEQDLGKPLTQLKVDGGAAANNLLLQIQADASKTQVVRAKNLESTGFGAALLAGLGIGMFNSLEDLAKLNPAQASFDPKQDRSAEYDRWLRAIEVSRGFQN
jgi:glycerol kinase